jgi:prophage maintenance system killer protein
MAAGADGEEVSLLLNGLRLTASEADTYDAVIGAVDGSRTESDIADWLRESTVPVR